MQKDTSRALIIVSTVILFVAMALCFLLQENNGAADDVLNFYACGEWIKSGLLPYKDFVFEFPPFALIFFLIPSIFTSSLTTYVLLYDIEVVVLAIITLIILLRIADILKYNKYLVTVIFLSFVLVYLWQNLRKFDMSTLMVVTMAIYFHIKQRYPLSYGLLAVGTLTKMYPGLLILVFLLIDIFRHKNLINVLKGLGACVAVGLIAIIPLMAMTIPIGDIFSFTGFHMDRGFQIESVMGIIIQTFGALGLTQVWLQSAHFTYDVISPISDALLPYWGSISAIIFIATIALISLHIYKNRDGENHHRDLLIYCLVIITIFLVTNKVFSTQYMVWLYVLFTLLSIKCGGTINRSVLFITTIIIVLSSMMIIWYMPNPLFLTINIIRDTMIIILLIHAILYLLNKKNMFADPQPQMSI